MEITPKTRKDTKDPNLLRIFINVHDRGKYPIARPLVKGVKIHKKNWNKNGTKDKKNWVRSNEKNYKEINQQIYDLCIQWEAELKGYTVKELSEKRESRITGGNKNFIQWFEKYKQTKKYKNRNLNTKAVDRFAMNRLLKYLEEHDLIGLQLKNITKDFVEDYYQWLLEDISEGSANQYINTFKALYNIAVEREGFKIKEDPFKIEKKKAKTENKSLTKRQLHQFANVEIPDKKYKLRDSHTIFMYQFWGAFRVIDVIFTKWKNFKIKDDKILVDFWTQKNEVRIIREVNLKVIETLLPCIYRYKDIKIPLKELNNQIESLQEEYDKIKDDEFNLDEAQTVLNLVKEGLSIEEIQGILNQQKLIQEGLIFTNDKKINFKKESKKVKIDRLKSQKENLLKDTFIEVVNNHSEDYVFKLAEEYDLIDPKEWKIEEDRKKYQVATATHYYRLNELAKLANIPKISSHVARHTATQFLLDSGVSSHQASEYLTHESLTTTETYRSKLGNSSNKLGSELSKYL